MTMLMMTIHINSPLVHAMMVLLLLCDDNNKNTEMKCVHVYVFYVPIFIDHFLTKLLHLKKKSAILDCQFTAAS